MEIADTSKLHFEGPGLKHRGNGLWFKHLFLGDEDDPKNNYTFVLARQKSFYSPVHRHNFDQFRYPTLGDINILPEVNVHQGELCYHPEGVYYGPQDDGDELKEVLVLQFGGASGQGFVSHAKLKQSQERLYSQGKFENGKFFRRAESADEASGYEEPIDAFQALWEDQMGRPLVYPEGRYDRIITMHPDAYGWAKLKGFEGVWKKTLGIFSERETRAEVIKIEKGASWKIAEDDATHLFYVLKGNGQADNQTIQAEWAGRILAGKCASVKADTELQILHFVLPIMVAGGRL